MSYLDLLNHVTLFRGLSAIDRDLAARTREKGCPHCGGPLHTAHYQRKPRGGHRVEVPAECRVRLGLCCGACRRRVLPPSVLYLGRRVYWGSVVLLVTAVVEGLQRGTIEALCSRFRVARRTVKRWLEFFRVTFPGGKAWQGLRGHVSAAVSNDLLPCSFFAWWFANHGCTVDSLIAGLRLLGCGP